jgi:arylsulfatase A-like enzyme
MLAGAGNKPPNVVIILADDLGWADVGFHGGPIDTPSIDRIASEGVELNRFYTAPMCSPTRAMLMTGRDPIRFGLAYEQVNPWDNAGVPDTEHFMPESFRAAGYQTAVVGKWHLGHTAQTYHPNQRGFDHFYGHLNTAIDYWTHARRKGIDSQHNGETVRREGYLTDLQGADAAAVIRNRDPKRPLFLYVPFNAPHNPMQAPEDLIEKYKALSDHTGSPGFLAAVSPVQGKLREHFARQRQIYAAMVDSMDQAIGEILKALDDEGIADNTLVLFSSDNGGFNIFGGDNMPLKGQKTQSFEGGVRVSAAMRWPGKLAAGGKSLQMMTAMDVFPTLVDATGISANNSLPLDGISRWSALQSGTATPRTKDLFLVSEVPVPGQFFYAAYSGPWKLVEVDRPGSLPTLHYLYRYEEDPYENQDLAQSHPQVVADLAARLAQWRKLEPQNGLRRHPGPHPGWQPPRDWAQAIQPMSNLRAGTISDFAADSQVAQGGQRNVLLHLTEQEQAAMQKMGAQKK